MFDILIQNGRVIDGSGNPWFRADVGIEGERIVAVGPIGKAEAAIRIDATDKIVAPGFIDAHVHGDLMVLADPYHEPAIRQGVTTYILGQDGVAMAPGTPETIRFMRRYTAGFSGNPELPQQWSSMADYLACFERTTAVNVACLIPNGNIRMDVMGLETRPPTADELKLMRRKVREAMEQGAVGLSTGMDYIPSLYARTEELIELCQEIAPFNGVYVSHMRRYDPEGVHWSMDEVFRIGRDAGCPVHISHFNSQAELALPKLDVGRHEGIDVTYDLYCYLAGSSILAMVALPGWIQEGGVEATLARLRDPAKRAMLQEPANLPRGPLENVRISYVASPQYKFCEGHTLDQCVSLASGGRQPHGSVTVPEMRELVCDLLVASEMAVGCVVPHLRRGEEDVRALMRHPAMMAGSDGIYTGSFPHPRGCGCFARYLGHYVRDEQTWSLEQAVCHLSNCAARRFNLKDRGLILPHMAADVVIFDPTNIADRSTYDDGKQLAVGMEHVLVNGELVLHNCQRTKALPGRALRP